MFTQVSPFLQFSEDLLVLHSRPLVSDFLVRMVNLEVQTLDYLSKTWRHFDTEVKNLLLNNFKRDSNQNVLVESLLYVKIHCYHDDNREIFSTHRKE